MTLNNVQVNHQWKGEGSFQGRNSSLASGGVGGLGMMVGNGANFSMATETKIKVERLRRGESKYESQHQIKTTPSGRHNVNHDVDDDKKLKS